MKWPWSARRRSTSQKNIRSNVRCDVRRGADLACVVQSAPMLELGRGALRSTDRQQQGTWRIAPCVRSRSCQAWFVLGSWAGAFVPALRAHDKAQRLAGAGGCNTDTRRCSGLEAALVRSPNASALPGGLASSAWHIDQMGQPPRLGCLGMCTGQCAVVAVNSKCWGSMLVLDM